MKNRTKKYTCGKCEKHFSTGDGVPRSQAKCPYCGSIKVKPHPRLVPDKGFIRAFILYETKKCRECGRPLRSEVSIKRGFGPSCGAYYAEKYLDSHPEELGEKAKKRWTREEIEGLIQFASKRILENVKK